MLAVISMTAVSNMARSSSETLRRFARHFGQQVVDHAQTFRVGAGVELMDLEACTAHRKLAGWFRVEFHLS